MKMTTCSTLILVAATTACSPSGEESKAQETNAAVGENPLAAPAEYLGAAAAAKKSAVRVVDLAAVQKAIQMFNVSEGRYPSDLKELVTKGYMSKLPELPTGMSYQYDPQSGQVQALRQ
jgi:hypothetical protein